MSSYDSIDEALNTTSIEVSTTPENGCVKRKNQLKYVSDDIKHDYDYTRANLYSLIEKGQEALDSILEVAQEGQQPRAYEVVSQLLKNVGDTADKLMDLQQKKKELTKDDNKSPTTVNNSLFVGSTSELSKLLKKGIINNKVENEEE